MARSGPVHLAILFQRFGPYHASRVNAVKKLVDSVTAIEISRNDTRYQWEELTTSTCRRVTLFDGTDGESVAPSAIFVRIARVLSESEVNVIAVPGWHTRGAFAALYFGARRNIPMIMMSESTAADRPRRKWKESIKRQIVGMCSSALVGGGPQARYTESLGMPYSQIFTGYNVVDNRYFSESIARVRDRTDELRRSMGLPQRYFLASSRFVREKNLFRLVQAYASYRSMVGDGAWGLVLLGDGILRPQLERLIKQLGISNWVLMPGFKQYTDLPAYYGLADVFVHASVVEPWGLVVNEAMASGLPVLVSKSCGCAADLVMNGVNGYIFDACDIEQLAILMREMSQDGVNRGAMRIASRRIIESWTPEVFAENLAKAASTAMMVGNRRATVVDYALLGGLAYCS